MGEEVVAAECGDLATGCPAPDFVRRLSAAVSRIPSGEVVHVIAQVAEIRDHLANIECSVDAEWSLADLAERFDRERSTIAAWCRRGLFPGAWQDEAGRWRVPDASVGTYIRRKQEAAAIEAARLRKGDELRRLRRRAGFQERIANPPRPDIGGWRKKVKRA